jgi:endonuclease/exonuclease/phosphatase family metal-dependent hydrolase
MLFILLFISLLAALIAWACGGIQHPGKCHAPIIKLETAPIYILNKEKIVTILTWNISYAFGVGASGTAYSRPTRETVLEKTREIATVIRNSKAQIALLQEVDFNSDRTHGISQDSMIQEITRLPYAATAPCWKANYVPFPFLQFKDHFGKIDSGGLILSDFPILENQVERLKKPSNHWFFYNWFYLFRFFQTATLEIDHKPFKIGNVHLEAFNTQNRNEQSRTIAQQIERIENFLVLGGDFNSIPRTATKRADFSDHPGLDYHGDRSYDDLASRAGFSALPIDEFSFPSDVPNRRIDHFLIRKPAQILDYTLLKTGNLSDHLPLIVRIRLP